MKRFEHVILGTGQATGTLLKRLIPTGKPIAVIERGKLGGSCVNYGCTPTKALVASARAVQMARRGKEFGFDCAGVEVDFGRVRERMNAIREASRKSLEKLVGSAENVTLIREEGVFRSDHEIEAGGVRLRGERIYVNVGQRPVVPPIEGLAGVPWFESTRLLDLETLPGHLIVVGGGYVGVEFSQIFRRLGSEVTLVQKRERLVPREDEDTSRSIRELLESEGVNVLVGARATGVSETHGGIRLQIVTADGKRNVKGTRLLIAAGRQPNTDVLNLNATEIETDDRGHILVDEHCLTNVEGVYALGDVNGQGAFTHTSVNDAEIVLDHLFGGPRNLLTRIPIYAVFTDPPLGRVGMTEREALASGKTVMKAQKSMGDISRAVEMGETFGFARLLVDADTDQLIGASIHGARGDEIAALFAAVMHGRMTCREFRQLVLIHPTIAESMPFLFDNLEELRNGDVESARRTDRDAAGQDAAARRESLDGEAVVHREPAPTGGEVTTKN